MLIVATVAFVAGLLTILAPCTLVVVPLILGASATGGQRRSAGIVIGFGLTFVVTAVLLASTFAAAGLTTDRLRLASAVILGLAGLTLVVERAEYWSGRRLAPMADLGTRAIARRPGDGLAGGLLLGGAIGLVWAPCVGPIMAAVIATAVTRGPGLDTAFVALAYVAGAISADRAHRGLGPSREHGNGRRGAGPARPPRSWCRDACHGCPRRDRTRLRDRGPDRTVFQAAGAARSSPSSNDPTSNRSLTPCEPTERATDTAAEHAAVPVGTAGATDLPDPLAALPANVVLEDLGPAPEFAGITSLDQLGPADDRSLRGKVVLVEFWTFGCINCQHVQPYVKAWYDRYASAGLVVLGVHTPELSFERDVGNVRDAVAKAGIRYPVAFDPAYATWNAYRNSYWPAFYFVDRSGPDPPHPCR